MRPSFYHVLLLSLVATASAFSPVHDCAASRERRTPTSLQQVVEYGEVAAAEDAHAFLRFSPLIGGPPFLPLHVEVILAVEGAGGDGLISEKMDTVYVRGVNDLKSTPFLREGSSELHRFDFLPSEPSEIETLIRLMTLGGVPGRVRHRIVRGYGEESRDNSQTASYASDDDDCTSRNQDGSGVSILIPIGSLSMLDDCETITAKEVLSTAMEFKRDYTGTLYKELRILGGKNCLSFALDLLMHVKSSTGTQRLPIPNRLDIK